MKSTTRSNSAVKFEFSAFKSAASTATSLSVVTRRQPFANVNVSARIHEILNLHSENAKQFT